MSYITVEFNPMSNQEIFATYPLRVSKRFTDLSAKRALISRAMQIALSASGKGHSAEKRTTVNETVRTKVSDFLFALANPLPLSDYKKQREILKVTEETMTQVETEANGVAAQLTHALAELSLYVDRCSLEQLLSLRTLAGNMSDEMERQQGRVNSLRQLGSTHTEAIAALQRMIFTYHQYCEFLDRHIERKSK